MCKWDIAEHAGAPTAVYLASLSSLRSAAVGFQVFSLVVDFFRPVLTASPLASICLTNSLLSAMVSVGVVAQEARSTREARREHEWDAGAFQVSTKLRQRRGKGVTRRNGRWNAGRHAAFDAGTPPCRGRW